MSWEIGTPNTATALAAMSPESVRVLWQKEVDMGEQQEDFFGQFEGTGKDNSIMVINDTSVDKGLEFRITARAGYYNKGKSGDGLFTAQADFAIDVINNNTLKADYLRNATSATQRTDEFMGMQGELVDGQAAELGKWMGREKTARAGMTFRLKGGSQNLLYSNGKTEDTLVGADGLTYDDILYMGQALKPLGGRPCEVATVRGSPVYKYLVIGTTPGLFSLKQDSDYKTMLREAMPREKYDENPLYTGGYSDIDGHRIMEFNPIDADGYSIVGSFFNPKAYLGVAITPGTSTFVVYGGGSAAAAAVTNIEYFKFFSNFAFEFLPSDIYVPGSTEKYFLIVNPKGSVTAANPQPGGVGMYAYTTGNNGNTITITKRLASVQNGPVALATVGSVTWNTGVWNSTTSFPAGNSMTHPVGSTIVACNTKGQTIGDTIMTGAMAMLRGYGKFRNSRTQWDVDGGFETRKYIKTVFGQVLRKNVNDVYPGFVRVRHSISYPELGLPTIV